MVNPSRTCTIMRGRDPSGPLVFKLLEGLGRSGVGGWCRVASISWRGGPGVVSTDHCVGSLSDESTETETRHGFDEGAIGDAEPCEKGGR